MISAADIKLLFSLCGAGDLVSFTKVYSATKHDLRSIVNIDKHSLIQVAVFSKHIALVNFLLDHGHAPCLHTAVEAGVYEAVEMFLRLPLVDGQWSLNSCIEKSSQLGHLDILHLLLAKRLSLGIDSYKLDKALLQASGAGHLEVVTTLIRAGADANYSEGKYSRGPGTPVNAAMLGGHEEVVDLLLAHGAERGSMISYAVKGGHYELARRHVSADDSVDTIISTGLISLAMPQLKRITSPATLQYCLDIAMMHGNDWGCVNLVQTGIPIPPYDRKEMNVRNLLIQASRSGCVQMCKILLNHRYPIAAKNKWRHNALSAASDPATVKLLLDNGAHKSFVNRRSGQQDTRTDILDGSCREHQPDSVKMIIDRGYVVPYRSLSAVIMSACSADKRDDRKACVLLLLEAYLRNGCSEEDIVGSFLYPCVDNHLKDPSIAELAEHIYRMYPSLFNRQALLGAQRHLSTAVKNMNVAMVKFLLDIGVDANTIETGCRDVIHAFHHGRNSWGSIVVTLRTWRDVMCLLLSAGASPTFSERTMAMFLVDGCHTRDSSMSDELISLLIDDIALAILARPVKTSDETAAQVFHHDVQRKRKRDE